MAEERKVLVERRKGKDAVTKWIRITSLIGWLLMLAVFIIVTQAKPPIEGFFDRFLDVEVRKTWDEDLLKWSFYLLVLQAVLCILAMLANLRRLKRKTDRISYSVIFLEVVAIVGIIIYIVTSKK